MSVDLMMKKLKENFGMINNMLRNLSSTSVEIQNANIQERNLSLEELYSDDLYRKYIQEEILSFSCYNSIIIKNIDPKVNEILLLDLLCKICKVKKILFLNKNKSNYAIDAYQNIAIVEFYDKESSRNSILYLNHFPLYGKQIEINLYQGQNCFKIFNTHVSNTNSNKKKVENLQNLLASKNNQQKNITNKRELKENQKRIVSEVVKNINDYNSNLHLTKELGTEGFNKYLFEEIYGKMVVQENKNSNSIQLKDDIPNNPNKIHFFLPMIQENIENSAKQKIPFHSKFQEDLNKNLMNSNINDNDQSIVVSNSVSDVENLDELLNQKELNQNENIKNNMNNSLADIPFDQKSDIDSKLVESNKRKRRNI